MAVIDEMQITVPELAPGLNGNGGLMRMHWATYGKIIDTWTWSVMAEAGQCKMLRATVSIDRYYASNPMDVDNLYATAKVPLDALRKAGVIPDDDPSSVVSLRVRQHKVDKVKDQRTVITLRDPNKAPSADMESIAASVTLATGVSLDEMRNKSRKHKYADARHIAFYIAYHFGYTLQFIGDYFGGRDHSTVIHGRDRVADQLKTNADLARKVNMSEGFLARRRAA